MNSSILIVEDNPDNMRLFAWTLEDEGYTFQGVRSAEEALQVLEKSSFDLVLMDISLPGMDGKEATRRIRANPRLASLPVIAVTAHAIKGEDEAILASGVDALVTKPIDEAMLLRTIRTSLKRIEVSLG
jgi:two-component system, cell cycle response regulator DivK